MEKSGEVFSYFWSVAAKQRLRTGRQTSSKSQEAPRSKKIDFKERAVELVHPLQTS